VTAPAPQRCRTAPIPTELPEKTEATLTRALPGAPFGCARDPQRLFDGEFPGAAPREARAVRE
jgi:hypothetical protein